MTRLFQDWAKLGECKKNPDYMNIYCSKVYSINKSKNQLNDNETLQSCKKCSGGCEDENKSCAQWAKKVIVIVIVIDSRSIHYGLNILFLLCPVG